MDQNEAGAAVDELATLAAPEEHSVGTPEAFLARVSAALKTSDKVDADLAAILSLHILTVTPHANAIVHAKAAILALAAKRAAPAEQLADA